MASFFLVASSAVLRKERMPGASTAAMHSANECLPAPTAAFRCREQHHVDPALDHVLVGVEAQEAAVSRDLDALGLLLAEEFEALIQAVRKDVAHRRHRGVLVGPQGLDGGAGAPPAAANQADRER